MLKRLIPSAARPGAKSLYWRALPSASKRARLARRLRGQSAWCRELGSPLYAGLLERVSADVELGGPCWAVLRAAGAAPAGADDALPLRFMAGVHRLVLLGQAPLLAFYYPSAGGTAQGDPWRAFIRTVEDHAEWLRDALQRPVQTNEVSRAAALVGGFLVAARQQERPLRILELGASAGLNLWWDRYRYEGDGAAWGNPTSPVRFQGVYVDGTPPFEVQAQVVGRAGCDLNPLDPSSSDDRLTLVSLVWPDQLQRFHRLRAALDLARREPVRVERADALEWLAAQLEHPVPGVTTLVFHSFFEQYLPDAGRERLHAILAEGGARASTTAPLAHLRMGWSGVGAEVELTTWPREVTRLIATADNQGGSVRWLGGP